MLFLVVVYVMVMMVVWLYFFLVKYCVMVKVLCGVNLYWWKRLTSSFEFGAMYVILF